MRKRKMGSSLRSVLLQATFLSGSIAGGSVAALSILSTSAFAQSCTLDGDLVSCPPGPAGQVILSGSGSNGDASDTFPVPGGAGGDGQTAVITNGTILGSGSLTILTLGGNGGAGVSGEASYGGPAGAGGGATIDNTGNITTPATYNYTALSVVTNGGTGGNGGNGNSEHDGAPATDGGAAGSIVISNSGVLTVLGGGSGIGALAIGGAGGVGGSSQMAFIGDNNAGQSGNGGAGGKITITNQGAITTTNGTAISAFGTGGAGGNGPGYQTTSGYYSSAGNGGGGSGSEAIGNGIAQGQAITISQANVAVSNSAAIGAAGGAGIAVDASGGASGIVGWYSNATGGTGGNGGTTYVTNSGAIRISGDGIGISATALGGAGGQGGYHTWEHGGNGGDGGYGGIVTLVAVAGSSVSTEGASSHGIFGSADGGAGAVAGFGDGNTAVGGNGGHGGTVFVTQAGAIQTTGAQAAAIYASAKGGAAGNPASETFTVVDGGASGGHGGTVNVTASFDPLPGNGAVTSGTAASAIVANADGGKGGVGNNGGAGGNAGSVTVSAAGTILVTGDQSNGIFATAQGGLGGYAEIDQSGNRGVGGAGGNGGAITITNTATITAAGAGANGIYATSQGGAAGGSSDLVWPVSAGSAGAITITSAGAIAVTNAAGGAGILVDASGGWGCSAPECGPNAGGDGAAATLTVHNSVTTAGSGTPSSASALVAPAILVTTSGGSGGVGATYSEFGAVGSGGNAGAITVNVGTLSQSTPIVISTAGTNSPAIYLDASGGAGGIGSIVDLGEGEGSGGAGGASGGIALNISSPYVQITTIGDNSAGIVAQSLGGVGGAGDYSTDPQIDSGGSGGDGGDAGVVTVITDASISTNGDNSSAIIAMNSGGAGGTSGSGQSNVSGGNGGTAQLANVTGPMVYVGNSGSLLTRGINSYGIFVSSVGGNGGASGGNNAGTGAGALGGNVNVDNSGTISTLGDSSHGIVATSVGGGGGAGSSSSDAGFFVIANGGIGASGAAAGTSTLTNSGAIFTYGDASNGLFGFSVGGGGGAGGSVVGNGFGAFDFPAVSVTIGGNGGSGATGGIVGITNAAGAQVSTFGVDAPAIHALSLGGAGGIGGQASASTYSAGFGQADAINVTIDIAGSGGSGGTGGAITVDNEGYLSTIGAQSPGILALSLGGGGGEGGNAYTQSYSYGVSESTAIALTMGGTGGAGSAGGTVNVNNDSIDATIATFGFASDAIMAMSIGGGGGLGGIGSSEVESVIPYDNILGALPIAFSVSASVTLTVGGNGGDGGIGKAVTVDNNGDLLTFGIDSRGILAQSIGGSGGNASAGQGLASQEKTIDLTIGGNGGSGGNGGIVTIDNESGATIATFADGAHGVVAQSIGGGGGTAGSSSADVGGEAVDVALEGMSKAIIEQMIKYAETGALSPSSVSPSADINLSIGGRGGAGGNGGSISVVNDGTILTGAGGGSRGDVAFGIFAQSVGGGGGAGGAATVMGTRIVNAQMAVGGNGGAYGSGAAVGVANDGAIVTSGDSSFGVLAQSIGGGGGVGGLATGLSQTLIGPVITIGGTLSSNSGGGSVTVTSTSIATSGSEAHAIVAQSIGGGGGLFFINQADYENAGQLDYQEALAQAFPDSAAQELSALSSAFQEAVANSSGTIELHLGGALPNNAGSGDGSAETVSVTNNGLLTTSGAAAFGILAQSIGGGGGFATDGSGVDVSAIQLSGSLGGSTGFNANLSGGAVDITLFGGSGISTTGAGATAILAQSIGGGGGYTGAIDATGASYSSLLTTGSDEKPPINSTVQGGAISLIVSGSTTPNTAPSSSIATTGDNAHGIVAQSLTGGGGLVGDASGILLPSAEGNASRGFNVDTSGLAPGSISIDYTGSIATTGNGSVAIFAQSGVQGTSGAIDRSIGAVASGDVTITINSYSNIAGGSGTGEALMIDAGANNTVTIAANSSVGAASGLAISSLWGSNTVTNNGTVIGDLQLINTPSAGGSTFTNTSNATYRSNIAGTGTIDLGSDGAFANAGTFDIGGVGNIETVNVTGQFQMTAGVVLVDVEGASSSDLLSMTQTSLMDGRIGVNVTNSLSPSGLFTIMTAGSDAALPLAEATAGMTVVNEANYGPQVTWQTTATQSSLQIAPEVTFVPANLALTPNELAYAQHLQSTWDAGGSAVLDQAYAALINVPSTSAYQTALATGSPSIIGAGPLGQVLVSRSSMSSVMSCPQFQGPGTFLEQGECAWLRVEATDTSFTPGDFTGFNLNGLSYRLGAQKEIAPGWFAGAAASYNVGWFDDEFGYADTEGQSLGVSASLKHEVGPWLLSGAAHFSYGWYDANRQTVVGSAAYLSSSSYDAYTVSGRLKAEYEVPFQNWYLKPIGQIDLIYTLVPGFTEGGYGSAYDLVVGQTDGFTVTASPQIEMGGRFDLPDGSTLRPYGTIGATWYSNSSWELDAGLASAPNGAGSFTTTVDMPEVVANVGLGLQWSAGSGLDLRLNYDADFAADYLSQTGSARFALHF